MTDERNRRREGDRKIDEAKLAAREKGRGE